MPRKTITKKVSAARAVRTPKVSDEISTPKPGTVINTRPYLIPALIGGAIIGLAVGMGITNLQPAAIVNGKIITKASIVNDLIKQSGSKDLDTKVTEALIMQEAQKKNISATDKEVTDRITQIEKEVTAKGQNLDTLLQSQGETRSDLKSQMKIQILVEKMFSKDITVTDKEISDYFDKNKDVYGANATLASKADEIKAGLKNQKLSSKFQSWISDVKSKAKITTFLK